MNNDWKLSFDFLCVADEMRRKAIEKDGQKTPPERDSLSESSKRFLGILMQKEKISYTSVIAEVFPDYESKEKMLNKVQREVKANNDTIAKIKAQNRHLFDIPKKCKNCVWCKDQAFCLWQNCKKGIEHCS